MKLDLERLGAIVKDARSNKKWSQRALAQQLKPPVPRTTIALFEQGRRLPTPDVLEKIAEALSLPRPLWEPFVVDEMVLFVEFEATLSDLVGQPVSLERLNQEAIATAQEAIHSLFHEVYDDGQARDAFNHILVYYGVEQCSGGFFQRYFEASSFASTEAFRQAVEEYQMEAIRLFSTFSEAYRKMNAAADLEQMLQPLQPRDPESYTGRKPWSELQWIDEEHLPDLGYISAVRVRRELKEREVLSNYLRELAQAIRDKGSAAIAEISVRRQRKMDTLLRKFDSELPHGPISPLFSPDPVQLEREAQRVAPSGHGDLDRIALTQRKGLSNLSRYLTADFMDVYIATSMRTEADFVSVNRFVTRLFSHPAIAPLHLRYFNPTQSWIEDRVAKGLVEALMLRRADFTFYMAQKTDTFGKDSEASVALGQGKPVIVYVPRLYIPDGQIDTDGMARCDDESLKKLIRAEGTGEDLELDDTLDHEGLHAHLLSLRLKRLNPEQLAEAVRKHWADFDLFAEAERIQDAAERSAYSDWLQAVIRGEPTPALPEPIQEHINRVFVAVAMRFERRARLFREVHPLALQVILSTGVLNGMLVARSIDNCAQLLHSLIRNQLDFELQRDEDNIRLIEKTTHSTVRVIPRNLLIANAFEAFYKSP